MHGGHQRLGELTSVDLPGVDTAGRDVVDAILDVGGHRGEVQPGGEHGAFAVEHPGTQIGVGVEFSEGRG